MNNWEQKLIEYCITKYGQPIMRDCKDCKYNEQCNDYIIKHNEQLPCFSK